MKKEFLFAITVIFFASCGSSNQTTNTAEQTRLDSMSQAMTRQHLIDSVNAANTANNSHAAVTPVPERRSHESYSHERSRSYSGSAPVNNNVPPPPVVVAPAAPVVTNTVVQPSAADIAAQKKADHKAELKSAAEGALIGAGAGAIGGAVAGKNKKYKEQDAAIGGGAGAILGAGAGLLLEKRKLKRDTTRH